MIDKIKSLICDRLPDIPFDTVAFSLIDFSKKSYESFQVTGDEFLSDDDKIYFDLASVTKIMTNGTARVLVPELFDEKMDLVLNHSAGIVWWGKLGPDWKRQILSYPIIESPTVYSDFSALRAMLMLEEKTKKSIYKVVSDIHDEEMVHWTELPRPALSPVTGWRKGHQIRGEVNDDNAFVIREKVSHAGLFSTIDGISKTILNLDKKVDLLKTMATEKKTVSPRFLNGWDTVIDPSDTLAGPGCGEKTFGHLGFTGTCLWIDPDKKVGYSLLTNATRDYWYQKDGLNNLRRTIGTMVWTGS